MTLGFGGLTDRASAVAKGQHFRVDYQCQTAYAMPRNAKKLRVMAIM
jgi:hypothetical protein